jgi:23S rRNA (guanosine2251-2'-O)-methyltransferase
VAFVLGNETDELSDTVRPLLDGVLGTRSTTTSESLGAAGAGTVASFELAGRLTEAWISTARA